MSKEFDLKAVISMVDRMSPTLNKIAKNLNVFRRQLNTVGQGAPMLSAGFLASLAVPTKLFAESESAGIDLKNSLLDKNGVAAGYEKLIDIATQLGGVLPGNTADFAKMATIMRSNSVATQDMIDGGLKAAAYLGVLVKDTDGAAQGLAKLSNVFGIAGVTGLIAPTAMPAEMVRFDNLVMLGVSLLCLFFAWTGMRIGRREGGVLLGGDCSGGAQRILAVTAIGRLGACLGPAGDHAADQDAECGRSAAATEPGSRAWAVIRRSDGRPGDRLCPTQGFVGCVGQSGVPRQRALRGRLSHQTGQQPSGGHQLGRRGRGLGVG
jgi:hypothetical protein